MFHSLKSDGAGNIWLAQGNQICLFHEGRFHEIVNQGGIQSLAATPSNAVWFVASAHLFLCNATGEVRDHGAFQDAAGPVVTAMLEDHKGAVWICTDGNSLFHYTDSGFERLETSHSSILSIAEDREGNIWAGTGGGGLDRISSSGIRLEAAENNQMLSELQSICLDNKGGLWGASRNGFLLSRIYGEWKPVLTDASFAGTVTCVATGRDGGIWIGTRNRKLQSLLDGNCTTLATNVVDGPLHALLPASNGDLWIVGDNALQRLQGGQVRELKLPQNVRRIYSIAEDAAANIWIGANGILLRFDGTIFVNETPRQWINGRPICCLYGTADGSMWIGSRGGGLVRYKNGQFSRIGTEQGLLNNYISQMVMDDRDWIWFGSNRGVFKVRRGELESAMENPGASLRPIVYGKNEGLISLEALFSTAPPSIFPFALRGADGWVRMLMHSGVVAANPNILADDFGPPPILLTQVTVDGQTIAAYGGVGSTHSVTNLKTLGVPLLLPPAHRHLQFDFTAFHFSAPENIHFRYQLAGFDTNWIEAGTARTAEYSRLNAADYQFRVEASVGDGPWSKMPAAVAFVVAPFFWQTLSFRFSLLLMILVLVVAVVRYISFRRLRLELREMEKRAAVERERGRIARDIHDDLGNRLTEIQLLAGLAQRNRAAPEKSVTQVNNISSAARLATDALDEIVWAINPHNDTLPHLINYLGQFTADFLRTAGIRCRMDLPENPPAKSVSAEVRHNLFLALKESLNNIARHSGATEVSLLILVTDESLSVIIRDNGRGFNGEVKENGADGLENMRQRIVEVGGEFRVQSKPGAGASLSFSGLWLDKK
jgi:signal transduction histidine kinase/streptogramin lyase